MRASAQNLRPAGNRDLKRALSARGRAAVHWLHYMKRVRGGGARDQLQAEGIVIFGDYADNQVLALALGLPTHRGL